MVQKIKKKKSVSFAKSQKKNKVSKTTANKDQTLKPDLWSVLEDENDQFKNMKDDELIPDHSDDEEIVGVEQDQKHNRLVSKLTQELEQNKIRKSKSTRSEANPEIDHHNIIRARTSKLSLGKLSKLAKNNVVKKSLKKHQHKDIIATPLIKPKATKAARQVNFKEVSEEISKYDPIVKQIRNAEQLVFPMEQEKLTFSVKDQVQVKPKAVSSIEKEVLEEISKCEGNIETDSKPLTNNEVAVLKSRKSIEEARMLHKEIQRRRTLISFQEAKFRRIKKIKSKKYHRLIKKAKLKDTVEEFDKLVADNSDKAIEKLEELDRLRALERASLKHRNTGKWAKHNKLRSKYDDNARQNLNDQLKISSEMMRKRSLGVLDLQSNNYEGMFHEDQEAKASAVNNSEAISILYAQDEYNPWICNSKRPVKVAQVEISDTKKRKNDDSDEKFFAKRIENRITSQNNLDEKEFLETIERDEKILYEGVIGNEANQSADTNENIFEEPVVPKDRVPNLITNIEDIKFAKKNKINPDEGSDNDENDDDEGCDMSYVDFTQPDMQKYLREAFADDDVVQEFQKEKKETERIKKNEGSSFLPGWGSWAGTGIKPRKPKRRKMFVRTEKPKKKDINQICNAIVKDADDAVGNKYKVKFRPAEVTNVKLFEDKISKPIGSTWNPQTVHHAMVAPPIITRMGAIIDPMPSSIVKQV